MAQGLLLFVPGLIGSELWLTGSGGYRRKAWIDPASIFQGTTLEVLGWGKVPDGLTVEPGEVLELNGFGYPGLLRSLMGTFGPLGYDVLGVGYDFRDSVMANGTKLANGIRVVGGLANGVLIVTHSMGGLVAQVALANLKATGEDRLVKSVCAIAPPFAGSYGTVEVWREQESGPDLLGLANFSTLTGYVANFVGVGPPPFAIQAANRQRAIALYTSWPGTYDLLPRPDALDDPADINRGMVYLGSSWGPCLVPPGVPQLLYAQNTTWPYLVANPPDPVRWTVVACVYPAAATGQRLKPATGPAPVPASVLPTWQNPYAQATYLRQQQLPSVLTTRQGDGRVTLASQTVYKLPTMLVEAAHDSAPMNPVVLANLPSLLGLTGSAPFPPVALNPVFPTPAGV